MVYPRLLNTKVHNPFTFHHGAVIIKSLAGPCVHACVVPKWHGINRFQGIPLNERQESDPSRTSRSEANNNVHNSQVPATAAIKSTNETGLEAQR